MKCKGIGDDDIPIEDDELVWQWMEYYGCWAALDVHCRVVETREDNPPGCLASEALLGVTDV